MNRWFLSGFLLVTGTACLAGSLSAWPWSNEQRKAERELKAGNLEKALRHYEMARLVEPDNPALDYNVGNVLHMGGRFPEAITEYAQALDGSDQKLAEMTHYNSGNTYYRMGDLEKAVSSYVKALLENPQDVDAKHNLEMALKVDQQKQHEQEQDKKGGEDKEKSQEEEKEPDQKQQDEEEGKGSPEEEEPRPREGELTREQAERILNALNEQEKEERKELKEARSRTGVRVERDW